VQKRREHLCKALEDRGNSQYLTLDYSLRMGIHILNLYIILSHPPVIEVAVVEQKNEEA
jgi:hypothetical protein